MIIYVRDIVAVSAVVLAVFNSCHADTLEQRIRVLEGKTKPTVEIIVDRTFDGDTGRHGYKLDKIIHEAKKSQKGMTIAMGVK